MNEEGEHDQSEDGHYEVGYGRPPKHTRFKPGQSGNSRGRPLGRVSQSRLVRKVALTWVTVRQGPEVKRLRNIDLVIESVRREAARGNPTALQLYARYEIGDEMQPEVPTAYMFLPEKLTLEEWEEKYRHFGEPGAARDYRKSDLPNASAAKDNASEAPSVIVPPS